MLRRWPGMARPYETLQPFLSGSNAVAGSLFCPLSAQDRDLLRSSAAGHPDSQMFHLVLCKEGKSTCVPVSDARGDRVTLFVHLL